jgi:IS1 family transposase
MIRGFVLCLETFAGAKANQIWIWTAVNHFWAGILTWGVGDHRAQTFEPLWQTLYCWHCYFDVTDGWKVYPILSQRSGVFRIAATPTASA